MTKTQTIETVLFELDEAVTTDDFVKTVSGSTKFLESCPGFISRRLSNNQDGLWIDHVEWASLEDAKSAAARISSNPHTQEFIKSIHGPSVKFFHTTLCVAIH